MKLIIYAIFFLYGFFAFADDINQVAYFPNDFNEDPRGFQPELENIYDNWKKEKPCPHCTEEFLKNISFIAQLTKKCKAHPSTNEEGCSGNEQKQLTNYIVYFCGNMPQTTHNMNKQLLKIYTTTPMLNVAFLRGWSRVSSAMAWPVCVMCSLSYPNDPFWEKNQTICRDVLSSGR